MKVAPFLILLAVACTSPRPESGPGHAPLPAPESVPESAPEDLHPGLRDLTWLVGTWRLELPDGFIEEAWLPAEGGAMLGVGRTVKAGRMTSFEFLRIHARGDRIVYVAQPSGREAVEFEVADQDSERALFENPEHDFPQWILYERGDPGGLTATIGAEGQEMAFPYRRHH